MGLQPAVEGVKGQRKLPRNYCTAIGQAYGRIRVGSSENIHGEALSDRLRSSLPWKLTRSSLGVEFVVFKFY